MAAQSSLFSSAPRPLCAPPYSLLTSSAMDQRRFKIEDAHGPPRARVYETGRTEERPSRSDNYGGDWPRPADARVYHERSSALSPRPQSLRYGSSFPYSAVAGRGQRDEASTPSHAFHQDAYGPPPRPLRQPDHQDHQDVYPTYPPYPPPHQQNNRLQQHPHQQHQVMKQEQPVASWGPGGMASQSTQYRDDELRRAREEGQGRDDRDAHVAARRGPMPSLDSMLQRSHPADRHPLQPHARPHDAWSTRGETARPFVQDADRARPTGAGTPFQRYDPAFNHSAASSSSAHGPLPGIRRLSSLPERFSQSAVARGSSLDRAPLPPPPPVSSIEDRRRVTHPAVAQLRSNAVYDSSQAFMASPQQRFPQTRASNGSSPASDAASPRDSPKRSRHAANEMGTSGDATGNADGAAAPRKKKKRKTRICTTPGCDKLVVDHGVCIRHGGGKRCNVEGCDCRAQNKGLCWKHGGYTICQVEGCDKRAKSRGMCWSHGGGTQCKTDDCEKIAVSRGRCWAHGGGKRCKLAECQKPAAQRMNDYCSEHYAAYRATQAPMTSDARRGHDLRGLYD